MYINVSRSTELEVRGTTLLENFLWGSVTKSLRVFNLALESLLASLNLMRTGKVLQRCS